MKKSIKFLSCILAIVMLLAAFPVTVFAGEYSNFPIYKEMPEDSLKTAPTVKLNESKKVTFHNGTYTNQSGNELGIVSQFNKALKFVPTQTGYYEASIYCAERNRSISVVFGYCDKNSLEKNEYYSVDYSNYEYNVHTSREPSIASYDHITINNTAKAAAYLEKGKTYYIIARSNYDDDDVEKKLKKTVSGYTYRDVDATVKVYSHKHNLTVTEYSTFNAEECKLCSYYGYVYKDMTYSISSTYKNSCRFKFKHIHIRLYRF